MTEKEQIKNYIDRILKWADSIKDENGKSFSYYPSEPQFTKIHEEVHELVQAMLTRDVDEYKDAIGDIFVTLIVYVEKVMNELEYTQEEKDAEYKRITAEILRDTDEDCLDMFLESVSLLTIREDKFLVSGVKNIVRKLAMFSEYWIIDCINLAVNTIEQRLTDGRLYIEDGVVKKHA